MATKIPELWAADTRQRSNVAKEIRKAVEDHCKALVEKNKLDQKKCGRQLLGFWKRM